MKGSRPPLLEELLQQRPLAPLGPGQPLHGFRSQLEEASAAFPSDGDRDMIAACRAGLWLAFNFLDEAHALSQDIATPTGSYWHGILHRREPDASNARYWFRRVGDHSIFPLLAEDAQGLGLRLPSGRWDPFWFIDLCEEHRNTGTEMEMLLRRTQQLEWERLFDFCYAHTVDTA